ncbi:NADH/Ubiquinone/plastoquinone (complex I) [Pyrolobus fumarii 1A]|uniref:NADH/Ubiquinone/plastoquinone (Complex I) n=1 Tax=Pyrolobus fumarii (strain DSM 11204 / 1A) TaxID=694429 RepID=G0ED50_PYRF1|nr:NADH-quinone oxidoreductase subunit L [Pyrolobus fumarii]AEM39728.1 NADH/Ubiquinone/plastoquinone (complex I) [Pyrolobus fumarii 1A]
MAGAEATVMATHVALEISEGGAAVYASMAWIGTYIAAGLVLLAAALGGGRRIAAAISIAGLAWALVAALHALLGYMESGAAKHVLGAIPGLMVVGSFVDGLSAWIGFVVALLSLLIGIYSYEYMGVDGTPRYWFFFTFFVASMLLLVYATDVLLMFIGWEGTGLASYALIGYYFDDREEAWVGDPGRRRLGVPMWFTPTHSAVRAFVFTGLGDSAFLVALALIHNAVGTLDITTWMLHPELLHDALVAKIGASLVPFTILLFFMAALAKSAQFPFHEWLVTAMTGPTSVSALIHAATMVKAGVYAAARFAPIFYEAFGEMITPLYTNLAWLALLTAFSTATMALVARELKLVLAYSTASQLGYMMAAAFAGAAALGSLAATAHLISHAVFKAALFLIAGALIHAAHTRYVTEMRFDPRTMPVTAAAMVLAGASLAGVPMFAGFWSKDLVVSVLGPAMRTVALLTAFLTAVYTARMIIYAFNLGGHRHGHEPGLLMLVPYTLLAGLSLGLGVVWASLEHMLAEALHAHPEFHPEIALTGASLALTGVGLTAVLYDIVWRGTPPRVSGALKTLYDFLYDRWLINPIIYRTIVYPGASLSKLLASVVEKGVLDRLYHRVVPSVFQTLVEASHRGLEAGIDGLYHIFIPGFVRASAARLRSVHTGDISRYLSVFIVGVVVVALLAAWYILGKVGGW